MKSIIVSSVFFLGLSGLALAQNEVKPTEKREEVVKQREANQQKRIDEGVKNGALSAGEGKKLEAQQGRIEKVESKAMEDGKMSKKEFKKIEKMQDKASENIKRKKHNKKHS